MPRILHVIYRISGGGAASSMLNSIRASNAQSSRFQHSVLTLAPLSTEWPGTGVSPALPLIDYGDAEARSAAIGKSDIVVVHFWNTPLMYAFLQELTEPVRLLLRVQIGGLSAPHVITQALVDFADKIVVSSPFSAQLPVFNEPPDLVYNFADFSRMPQTPVATTKPTFTIGYIGTVSPVKMHPDFVSLCARVGIPSCRFVVVGSGDGHALQREAEAHEVRLAVHGYVADLEPVVADFDVFGYPLCEDNYSSSELVLQEIAYAGIPAVVLAYGGAQTTVLDGETGIVAEDETAYVRALAYLYDHPEERVRMGLNAADYARQTFDPEQAARQLHAVYEAMMGRPKRARALWPEIATGADLFVRTVGSAAPEFETSLRCSALEDWLAADKAIMRSTPARISEAGGGVLHYRNSYREDPALRLWAGLVLLGQGHHVRALAEFQAALALGFDPWRLAGYMWLAAKQLGSKPLMAQYQAILEQDPAYGAWRANV